MKKYFTPIIFVMAIAVSISASAIPPPSNAISTFQLIDLFGEGSSVDINLSGFPVVAYLDTPVNNLVLTICDNLNCSSSSTRVIDNLFDVGHYLSIKLNQMDYPIVSYFDNINNDIVLLVCQDVKCDNRSRVIIDGLATFDGKDIELQLSSIGTPVVSYFDDNSDSQKLNICDDIICANPTITAIANVKDSSGSLAINSNDFAVLTYFTTSNVARIRSCLDTICTTFDDQSLPIQGTGLEASLALRSNDKPIISYNIPPSLFDEFGLAICDDELCTSQSGRLIDTLTGPNVYHSMKLTGDDEAVTSYLHENENSLKISVCHDSTCSKHTNTILDNDVNFTPLITPFGSLSLTGERIPVISYLSDRGLGLMACPICIKPTIKTLGTSTSNGSNTSIVHDTNDFPIISFEDNTNDSLKMIKCNNKSCSTFNEITVDSSITVGETSIALTDTGVPVISYYEDDNDDLKLAICDDANCANPTIRNIDGVGIQGRYSNVEIISNNIPIIGYYDGSNFDVKLAVCNDALCTNPVINIVDGENLIILGSVSMALNNDGFPIMAYQKENNDLRIAICNNLNCTSRSFRDFSSTNNVGRFTSIKANSMGLPVAVFYDSTDKVLDLAICLNSNCSSLYTDRIDEVDDVGRFSSLELTADDLPIISYYDKTSENLKVMLCNDSKCQSSTITDLDTEGRVGEYSSLSLTSDGYPAVSYYDGSTNSNLKLVLFETGISDVIFQNGFE